VSNFDAAAATALLAMNAIGVRTALLLPPPFSPAVFASPAGYDYTELAAVAAAQPDRFAFLGGGGLLNSILHAVPPDSVTPAVRADFEARALAIASAGAAGFGEMTALHLSFFPAHPFLETPPDHELLLLLADIAADHGMPVDLHMEAVVSDLELRSVFGPPNPQPPDVVHANIDALGRLLAHNAAARIVWTHAGWDNTGDMTVALFDSLMTAHPNLCLAIKITPEPGLQFESHRPVDAAGVIRPEWLQLISEFPERIVMGADEFFGIPGLTPPRPPSFEATWAFVDQLPASLAARLAAENVRAIYRLGGASVDIATAALAAESIEFGPSVPNPTANTIDIALTLPAARPVSIELFDVHGRSLGRIHEGRLGAGAHTIFWDGRLPSGSLAPPGIYLARLTAGDRSASTKVVIRR
jgi:hypothetical protein